MDGNISVADAIRARYSCRAFLSRPVGHETIAEILGIAARAPSGGNLQPWHVDVLTGAPLAALKAKVAASLAANPKGEGTEFPVYPPGLADPWRGRRFACGEQLYESIGIPREDRPARLMQFARNFDLFGAPVGLFFSIPRHFGPPQWAHLGMFIQNVMLLAAERGLATCPQEAWAIVHKSVGEALGLPPERMLYCGMALGYGDEAHPINQWRTERESLDAFATFAGF
ncbi:nitroreductase [Sphingosinicella sp.]|uniref:nitroreductase n=1 Tax=Sphingosinicella sp. TaxID=1917971 RepID=UPI00403781F7